MVTFVVDFDSTLATLLPLVVKPPYQFSTVVAPRRSFQVCALEAV